MYNTNNFKISKISKRALINFSPPLKLSPGEAQVLSLTYDDLTALHWYEAYYGLAAEFPQKTQHIFRYIIKHLPFACRRCDFYTCISPKEKFTLNIGINIAKIIHKDIKQNLYRFTYKIPKTKIIKAHDNALDLTHTLNIPYRLTICFAFDRHGVIDIPHREFIYFSLPEDTQALLKELQQVFEEFYERFYYPHIHILVTLEEFKNIKKGFIHGIVPIEYALGAIVRYDYDPVDWSWVDNAPFRDPSNHLFTSLYVLALALILMLILFHYYFI
jgi:hypothetical protein